MGVDSDAKYQYLAGICVNIISVSNGAFVGWISSALLVLQSTDSPLVTGPMLDHEAGWVCSMLCIGGAAGTIFFSWCAETMGRKRCLLLVAVPALLGWLIIPFATNCVHLAISRFLGGFAGGGIFGVIPIYTTEIAEDRVRGTLGTLLVLTCNLGILIVFIVGSFLDYVTTAWMLSLTVVAYLVCFSFLPETPAHLIKKNKFKEAERSLMYFRNMRGVAVELPSQLKSELERLQVNEKTQQEDSPTVTWKDFNNRVSRKAIFIGISLMALNQGSGCFAMISYTATIFKQSGSDMSPNMAAVTVGIIQLLGSYMATMLVERAGRKILLIISALGTGMGHFCLAGYSLLSYLGYDTSSFGWVPVFSFSFTIFIACWGVLPLPFLLLSEIIPSKIREMGSMICMLTMWIFSFLMLKYLPIMSAVLGMHGMMFAFGTCCFIGVIFIVIFVPETKGKSIEQIMSIL